MRGFEIGLGLGAACMLWLGCNARSDVGRGMSSGTGAVGAPQPVAQAAPVPSGTLPCEVSAIAQQRCQLCHASTPLYGAPMPLVTFADFHKPAKSDSSRQVYQLVGQRIHATTNVMPPLTQPQLMASELATLDAWIGAGAATGPESSCAATPARTGGAGVGAPTGSATPPPVGSSGTTTVPTATPSSDEQCFTFTAYGATKGTPYSVPATPDYYNCFNFSRPFPSDALGVRFTSIIDNKQAIHHWIMYGTTGNGGDGVSAACTGAHPDGTFLSGWAPGTPDRVMPPDVGMQMPGQGLQLEIHYNAPSAGMTDASGVQICISKTPRAHVAAVHPLGQEGFATAGPGDVVGNCVPKGPFPITILTSDPHMHKKGSHMSTIINHPDGSQTTLVDKPFDFASQILYDTPAVVNAGDTLTTTCSYNAPVTFGHGTADEMCYNFILAYPAGALAGGAGLSRNGNLCIDDPQLAAPTH
jgi:hypothetical protein